MWQKWPVLSGLTVAAVVLGLLAAVIAMSHPVNAEIPVDTTQLYDSSPGICIHGVIIFSGVDSVGVLWDRPPCSDTIDIRIPSHWAYLRKSTALLPKRCGILFRLPGFSIPMVDTMQASIACTYPVRLLDTDRRKAEG